MFSFTHLRVFSFWFNGIHRRVIDRFEQSPQSPSSITDLSSPSSNFFETQETMEEDSTWEPKIQVITHVLTSPTSAPSLYSQFFVSTKIPSYLNWEYPPILSPSLHLRWAFSLFVERVSVLGRPETSWRSKCPFHQPPPLVLAKGVAPAQWGEEERRDYVRKRLGRKPIYSNVHPAIPILIPNMLLFSLLLWDPFPSDS